MKNVITILVDSVFSECIGSGRTLESSTPFVEKLIKEGIYAPRVFSYAPYTDGATKGLYAGQPSLRDYGYYYGLNSSEYYHYRTFHDNGYETYGFYYPYYLIGNRVRNYIDNTVYTGGFEFAAILMGKYGYYAEKKKQSQLTDIEYTILLKYTDLMFDCWMNFYEKIESNPESAIIVQNIHNADSNGKSKLKIEYELYLKNKISYIDSILDLYSSHPLNNINDYVYDNAIDIKWIENNVYKAHAVFFKQLDRKQLILNIRNNQFDLKKMISDKRYFQNMGICLFSGRYNQHVSKRPEWQLVSSMNKKLEVVYKILENRKDNKKPFYISLHTEEPHNYVTFFSYDTKDKHVIDKEIEYLYPVIERCGKNFKGNLCYQLSLRYVDYYIKQLYEKLESLGLLKDTCIVIMADHGSSYTYTPVRNTVVNNFHRENYTTPLLVWNSDASVEQNRIYQGLYSAEDVQATVCKTNKLSIPRTYTGCSIPELVNGRDYVITEYMGPGCPDMITRSVWMSARNTKYMIAYRIPISGSFRSDNPDEVYDLTYDPEEVVNIADNINVNNNPELAKLSELIGKRFAEIQNETDRFLLNINDWNPI